MDLLNRLNQYRVKRRLINQTIDELAVLSDRELADLGILRHEIPRVAKLSVEAELKGRPADTWRRAVSQLPAASDDDAEPQPA